MSAPTAEGTHRAATRHRGIGEKDHETDSDKRCLSVTPTILAPRHADPTISGRVGVAPGRRAKKPAHQRDAFTAFAADRSLVAMGGRGGDARPSPSGSDAAYVVV